MDCFIYYLNNLWNFLKPQSCYELNIALMGLPNSGKSTFIKSLKGEIFEIDTIPTKYMEITTINYNKSMLKDLLGKDSNFKNFDFQGNSNNRNNSNNSNNESSPLLNNLNINIDRTILNEDVINEDDNKSNSNESIDLPDSLILKLFDLSGQFKYQNNLWKDIIIDKENEYNINLIIFFIDVSDELRIQESKCKLLEIILLNNDINRGGKQLPILIIGNKCDLIDDNTRPFLGGYTDVFDSSTNSYSHNNNNVNNNNINNNLTSSLSKNNDVYNNLLNDEIKSGSGTAVRSKRFKFNNHHVKYGNVNGSETNNDMSYNDSTNNTGTNNNSNNKKIINSSASIASKLFTKDELLLNFLGIEISDNKTRIFLTINNEIYDNFLKKNKNLNNLNKFTNVIRENLKFKLIELNFDVGIFTLSLKNDFTISSVNKNKLTNNKIKKDLNLIPSLSPSIFDKRAYSTSSSTKRSLFNDSNSLKNDIDNLSDVLNWIFGIH
ncbi:hypothetical protein B5S29_g1618 [[Candida] boidinii]|nr:hypothetical protein B5S29_g1618 [[Candida] boidinii]